MYYAKFIVDYIGEKTIVLDEEKELEKVCSMCGRNNEWVLLNNSDDIFFWGCPNCLDHDFYIYLLSKRK